MTRAIDTSAARAEILGRVRRAAESQSKDWSTEQQLAQQIPARIAQVRPPVRGDAVAAFKAKAELNLIQIHEMGALDDVPVVVMRILAAAHIAPNIQVAPALVALPWPESLTKSSAKARLDEKLTVSLATAGIAETGSLVLCSSGSAPSSLTFAPEQHVIVLKRSDIVTYLEDGLAKVKTEGSAWPRTVNLVSGPSRTADVAGIVVRPAHGPKSVHLIIIG